MWEGYSEEEQSWEFAKNVELCQAVDDFLLTDYGKLKNLRQRNFSFHRKPIFQKLICH